MIDKSHDNNDGKKTNSERWLFTYSDMITLLMIFFIIMYSMSDINATKFQKLANQLGLTLGSNYIVGAGTGNITSMSNTSSNMNTSDSTSSTSQNETMQQIQSKLSDYIDKNNLSSYVTLYSDERGVIISLKDPLFFNTGSAEVLPQNYKIIFNIAKVLKTINNYIRVEGYTDNVPISNSQYKSNWELSTSRATNIIELLIKNDINPERLIAVGYGEYKPIAPNNNDTNRKKNRRVDIVIMRSDYNKWEPYTKVTQ